MAKTMRAWSLGKPWNPARVTESGLVCSQTCVVGGMALVADNGATLNLRDGSAQGDLVYTLKIVSGAPGMRSPGAFPANGVRLNIGLYLELIGEGAVGFVYFRS